MNTVPVKKPKRNLFDLSHEVKGSGKFGYLYPVLLMEGLPGDTIRDVMTCLLRFAPMLSPVMHRMDVKTDFFFVPTRILCDSWEEFITGGQDGTAEPVLPYFSPASIIADGGEAENVMNRGTLWDHFGLPINAGSAPVAWSQERISVLPFRAYSKIYNDYFRDPNLDDEIDLQTEIDGEVSVGALYDSPYILRQRGWEKGYFTSALPFAQRGPSVLLPFDTSFDDVPVGVNPVGGPGTTSLITGTENPGAINVGYSVVEDDNWLPNGSMFAQTSALESSSTITINDLRRSMAIQSWLENNARGGARYNEQIMSHFATRVPDYRLQRAEYLGGGRQPVQISEVLATAEAEDVPVGDMAGHGISVGKSNRFTYHCQEHGFVIGIMSVVPKPSYASQGIPRMFSRTSKFDFAWPELAHLGEQEVLSKEIFFSFNNDHTDANNSVFGYLPRYAEYKIIEDRLAGDFRTDLLFWHEARNFTSRPTLSSEFLRILEDGGLGETDFRRIFAVQDGTDYLWFQLFHRLTAKRPLPYFGVPALNG